MEAKRNRQLTIWNVNTTVIQGYGSHVTRCYYEVSRFIMWLVSIVELNVLYLQQCGKWECILFIFDVTLHGFLFTLQYINNRKLTFVLSNPWWICALGIIGKNWFTRQCFAIHQCRNNPTHRPPCLLRSLSFSPTSTVFILSFTCKCPRPPPSHQEISKAMKGRQRLQAIPVERCSACA